MLASVVALCGVAIIVGNARMGSDILGIALACFMALAIAAMTVMVRRHKDTSMVAAAAISNFLGSVVSIPFAHGITSVTGSDLFILAMFGFFQVALGLTLFFLGSRLLPSGQAALISTLETPLMPFWVWLAFQRGSRAPGPPRRRPGDGRRHRRHHRRQTRTETGSDRLRCAVLDASARRPTISTQFGFLPIGYSFSLVSLPVALSIA